MKKMLNVEIGLRVRKARERLQLSRANLAELLNISALFLGYIECGQKGMSFETLISICNTLNVSADYLLFGVETVSTASSDAELLLRSLPADYLPLAGESLRTLLKTIAAVQAKEKEMTRKQNLLSIQIAARSGQNSTVGFTEADARSLEDELAHLRGQPSDFKG